MGVHHGEAQYRGRQAETSSPPQRFPARLRESRIQAILPENGPSTPQAGRRVGPPCRPECTTSAAAIFATSAAPQEVGRRGPQAVSIDYLTPAPVKNVLAGVVS